MKIAFYKGRKRFINRLICFVTNSKYSHVELVFEGGLSFSSSMMDGGVRFKTIQFDPNNWDMYELPVQHSKDALEWFEKNLGKGYDYLGVMAFVFKSAKHTKKRYFCSEAIAAALKLPRPHLYSPATLYDWYIFQKYKGPHSKGSATTGH